MNRRNIYFFKDYLIEKYGRPLYRIPIDLPLSCPHRQRDSGRGCIFCADDGARARHLRHNLDLPEQVRSGIDYACRRYQAEPPYIAYFQSFTNTNAPVDILRRYYREVLDQADFKMVIVSTRPDCLGDDVLDLLQELGQNYDLWVEMGVQSANDLTLERINRGHDFAAVESAVKRLAERKIPCAAHLILGLPGEDTADFIRTAEAVAALPFRGIKIHNLLVLRHTPLARLYAEKKDEPGWFNVMNEYEYAAALKQVLLRLPADWPVMRLTAEAPPEDIIAPKWWMSKGQFIDYFQKFMDGEEEMTAGGVSLVPTADGSCTMYHPEYRQHFHTLAGAASETQKKFVLPAQLTERLQAGPVKLLDIGFGLGYNAWGAVDAALQTAGTLEVDTLEKDHKTLTAGRLVFPEASREREFIDQLRQHGNWRQDNVVVNLYLADARQSICRLTGPYDVIFMDGFSPDRNPELWSYDFIRRLARLLRPDGILVTYSSAYPVVGALLRAGFHVGQTDAFGRKRGGIAAAFEPTLISTPLPEKELGIVMKSTAGAPWRDSGLTGTAATIVTRREKLIERLRRRGIPRWYKQ